MFVCLWLELCNAWGVMTQIIYRWSRMILLPGFTQASHPSVPSVKKHTCLMYVLVYICMCIYIYVYIHIIHTLYIYIYMLVLHILYINGPIDMDNLMDTLDGWMDGSIPPQPPQVPHSHFLQRRWLRRSRCSVAVAAFGGWRDGDRPRWETFEALNGLVELVSKPLEKALAWYDFGINENHLGLLA